ncbi:MAG: NfeD family protein [Chloroflexi bacterium]|nr:NfeD family protein [Chloroflexota bacterium]
MKPVVILVFALVNSIIEQALVAAALLWLLPQLGVRLPLALTIGILAMLAAWSVFTYVLTRRALAKKALTPAEEMVGKRGTALTRLAPDGQVRIQREIWQAVSSCGEIAPGDEIRVLCVEGLRLTVRKEQESVDQRPG